MRFLRAVLAAGLVAAALPCAGSARAQSPAELAAGRQLFVEALADEEAGRFAAALEKYRRVQGIRDTINVRYRIGTALEGTGQLTRAVEAYEAAIAQAADSPGDAEVVTAARARLAALRPRVAHLAVRVTSPAFTDAQVAVDDKPVAAQALADVPVDPGPHVVTATATGARPFRSEITVAEGGRAEVPVALEATEPSPPPVTPDRRGKYRTIGIITGAAGGLLMIGGAVVLGLRSSAISELNDSCPNGNCPASREQELRSTRDRAELEGPIGVAMLVTGVVAVGTGIALFTIAGRETKTATRILPSPTHQGAMLTLVRGF